MSKFVLFVSPRALCLCSFLFLLTFCFPGTSVGAAEVSPHEVFEQFIKAWDAGDENAGSFLYGTTQEHVALMQTFNSSKGKESCPNPASLRLVVEKIDGVNANVSYEGLNKAGAKITSKAKLVNLSDGWKIKEITPMELVTVAAAGSTGGASANKGTGAATAPTAPLAPLKMQFNPAANLSEWSRQALTLSIPNAPVSGTIGKRPFKSTKAEYAIWWKTPAGPLSRKDPGQQSPFDTVELTIYREGGGAKDTCKIKISMPMNSIIDRQTVYLPYKVRLANGQLENGSLKLEGCEAHETDCAGRVFLLNKTKDGKLPAYVMLRMQTNEGQAEIKGYLYATEMPQ